MLKLSAFLFAFCVTAPAFAQSSAAASAMDDWFTGERNEAYVFFGLGVVSAGSGAYLLTRDTEFGKGAGWTAIGFGAVEMLFATTYTLSLDPKHDELKEDLASDPVKFKADELDRMYAIADRFIWYRYAELGILATGTGLATYGFLTKKKTLAGIGLTAAIHAGLVLGLDYFAEQRTRTYIGKLEKFRPEENAIFLLERRRGWGFQAPLFKGAW
jgi:hypothetical protein